jgi:hypothetical protein
LARHFSPGPDERPPPGPARAAAYEARDRLSPAADAVTRGIDGRDACRWSQTKLRRQAAGLRKSRRKKEAGALLAYADARLAIWRAWKHEGGPHSRPPSDVQVNGSTPWYTGERYKPTDGADGPPW